MITNILCFVPLTVLVIFGVVSMLRRGRLSYIYTVKWSYYPKTSPKYLGSSLYGPTSMQFYLNRNCSIREGRCHAVVKFLKIHEEMIAKEEKIVFDSTMWHSPKTLYKMGIDLDLNGFEITPIVHADKRME